MDAYTPVRNEVETFEEKLGQLGYVLNADSGSCSDGLCLCNNPTVILYVHEDCEAFPDEWFLTDHPVGDMEWWKYSMCEEEAEDYLSSLGCGGHYINLAIFRNGQFDEEGSELTTFMDPTEPYHIANRQDE
jgi:hypothetical protein